MIYTCILILLILAVFIGAVEQKKDEVSQNKTSTQGPFDSLPIIGKKKTPTGAMPVPTLSYIYISGVKVKSFYSRTDTIDINKDEYLVRKNEYLIYYIPKQNIFFIHILGSPFPTLRQQAEKELLSILQITKEDACKLNVKIATYSDKNLEYANKYYLFSFCTQ